MLPGVQRSRTILFRASCASVAQSIAKGLRNDDKIVNGNQVSKDKNAQPTTRNSQEEGYDIDLKSDQHYVHSELLDSRIPLHA